MEEIKSRMKKLRLSAAASSLEIHNQYALSNKISYLEFLELLLEDEITTRKSNALQKRLKTSALNVTKTLDTYDFSYQPEIDKKVIYDLATCRFIGEKKNTIFMGKPGVGKNHLANAIGLQAINKGYQVLIIHANELIERLYIAKAEGNYRKTLEKLLKIDLLIIDELGFKKLPEKGVDDFFEIIRSRYEKGSIIITTNRTFEGWAELLGDPVMASAIIDRIIHHAVVIKITGESYRIKELKQNKFFAKDEILSVAKTSKQ
jgi:DNA replication protein DnaC